MLQVVQYWQVFRIKYGTNKQTGVIEDFYKDVNYSMFPRRHVIFPDITFTYTLLTKEIKYVKASILYM